MANITHHNHESFALKLSSSAPVRRRSRLVLDLIKGLRVEAAINAIHFSARSAWLPVIEKVLRSAIQNAELCLR